MIRLIIAIVVAEIIEHVVEYVFVQLKQRWSQVYERHRSVRTNENGSTIVL